MRLNLSVEYGYVRPRWKRGRKYLMIAERGWPGRGRFLYRIVARYQLSDTGIYRYVVVDWALTRGHAEAVVWTYRRAQLGGAA